jgi:hypothetical protein
MDGLGATDYTSSLMFAQMNGSGGVSVQSMHNSVRLDTRIRSLSSPQRLDAGNSAALARFLALIGNAPGILWRISDPLDVGNMVAMFPKVYSAISASRTPREALDSLYLIQAPLVAPVSSIAGESSQSFFVVEALLGAGMIAIEG